MPKEYIGRESRPLVPQDLIHGELGGCFTLRDVEYLRLYRGEEATPDTVRFAPELLDKEGVRALFASLSE